MEFYSCDLRRGKNQGSCEALKAAEIWPFSLEFCHECVSISSFLFLIKESGGPGLDRVTTSDSVTCAGGLVHIKAKDTEASSLDPRKLL